MNRKQLILNGETRKVLFLNYEYFHPVDKSEKKYMEVLYKNFPYARNDERDTFFYQYHLLPVLEHGLLDKNLESEARLSASLRSGSFLGGRGMSERDLYYRELMRLRYRHGLDRLIIPNIDHLYDMEVRPSEAHRNFYPDRLVGGLFNILLESTVDDDIL